MAAISSEWAIALKDEFKKEYYANLYSYVRKEYKQKTIFPPSDKIFNALKLTPLSEVKVLILGQDPYHEPGQACGLSFSVNKGVRIPPSLVNIYKEISDDLGIAMPGHGDLTYWTKQGVLLLNTVLTVEAHKANSHKNIGWEKFTDAIISCVNKKEVPVVFLLWGSNAISKSGFIDKSKHLVLTAPHPSPLSAYRGFFGCKHFSKTNEFLASKNISTIDWKIPE